MSQDITTVFRVLTSIQFFLGQLGCISTALNRITVKQFACLVLPMILEKNLMKIMKPTVHDEVSNLEILINN